MANLEPFVRVCHKNLLFFASNKITIKLANLGPFVRVCHKKLSSEANLWHSSFLVSSAQSVFPFGSCLPFFNSDFIHFHQCFQFYIHFYQHLTSIVASWSRVPRAFFASEYVYFFNSNFIRFSNFYQPLTCSCASDYFHFLLLYKSVIFS